MRKHLSSLFPGRLIAVGFPLRLEPVLILLALAVRSLQVEFIGPCGDRLCIVGRLLGRLAKSIFLRRCPICTKLLKSGSTPTHWKAAMAALLRLYDLWRQPGKLGDDKGRRIGWLRVFTDGARGNDVSARVTGYTEVIQG